uniref:GTP pyrophosphokinase n=1 Tax=Caulobacter phage S2L TaxID=3348356 RepID=A0AB74ULU7_9VIRU
MSDASLDQLASILTGLPTAPGAPLRQEDPTEFAIAAHGDQQYAGQPYLYHLQKVERILDDYGFLGFTWTAAAKLHDVIEDTHLDMTPEQRLEMIKEKFGEDVAALVWAVSGIGPTARPATRTSIASWASTPRPASSSSPTGSPMSRPRSRTRRPASRTSPWPACI